MTPAELAALTALVPLLSLAGVGAFVVVVWLCGALKELRI